MIRRFVETICDQYWLIENYEEAVNSTDMWELHHRAEVSDDGLHTIYSSKELMKLGLYYHRPVEELVFLSRTEHKKLHQNTIEYRVAAAEKSKGRITSDETRKKLSDRAKGRTHSDETRKKMSDIAKGRHFTDEHKRKLSEAKKGKPKPNLKYKWQDPDGNVYTMDKAHVTRWHPDWKLIEEQ